MAKEYMTHGYNGAQEMKPYIKKHIQDVALETYGITIEETEESAHEFSNVTSGDDYVYGYEDGFQGGEGAKYNDKRFVLQEFKKETSWSKQKYKNRIQRLQRLSSNTGNSMEGTEVEQIEQDMHMRSVRIGFMRSFWLGDTAKTITVGTTNTPDKRYNTADGIWTEIMNRVADDNIPRLALDYASSNSLIEVTQTGFRLKDDAAKYMFSEAYDNASDLLKSMFDEGDAAFFILRSIETNYIKSMEEGGSESAYTATLNGVQRKAFRNLPLIDMRIQDTIKKDFDNDKPFRIILTPPSNLAAVIGVGGEASSKYWFDDNSNTHRQRTQFEGEHGYIDPELLSVVY